MAGVSIELLGERHADAILRAASDPELSWTSSVPAHFTPEHVAAWIADNKAKPRASLTFAIRDEHEVVGAVTLKKLDAADRSGELAFWVGRDHRGRGLARTAGALAVDYAFNDLRLAYVHAHCLRDSNPASRKTLEALGFAREISRADLPVEDRFKMRFPGDAWIFYRRDR